MIRGKIKTDAPWPGVSSRLVLLAHCGRSAGGRAHRNCLSVETVVKILDYESGRAEWRNESIDMPCDPAIATTAHRRPTVDRPTEPHTRTV